MDLFELLAERGQRIAQAHGHRVAVVRAGSGGTYTATCVRCGALLVLRTRPASCGIGGSACRENCRPAPAPACAPSQDSTLSAVARR